MELVRLKLDRITSFWNDYVWNYKSFQNKIHWNDEVRTNYYGDILSYFSDTFDLLKPNIKESNHHENVFHSIGLLQIIYVQQDLIDELLRIFRLPKSSKESKQPARTIRNEVIGHPISRFGDGTFKSSTFWGRDLTNTTLSYVRYSSDNQFSPIEINHQVDEMLSHHKQFISSNLDKILAKINSLFNAYSKRLSYLENIVTDDSKFNSTVKLAAQIMEYIFELDHLFKPEILYQLKQKEKEHPRYQLAIRKFNHELIDVISGIRQDIEKYKIEVSIIPVNYIKPPVIIFNQKYVASTKTTRDFRYELSKLAEKKLYVLPGLKSAFISNEKICQEIIHLEMSTDNDLEYYSSVDYLRNLVEEYQKANS